MQYLYKVHQGSGLPQYSGTRVTLVGFAVTTTTGAIDVNWGDGSFQTISSGVPVSHAFTCIDNNSIPAGLWNSVQTCIGPDGAPRNRMFTVHNKPRTDVRGKNLSNFDSVASFVVVSAANPITGGLYFEPPIPSVTFTINYFTNNTVLTTFAPGGLFNSRPRVNTFRSDGSFVTVLTSTSSITVTMPMTTTYIPYFTAGIDLFIGDWQYCKIEPTNTGWINRPGTLNPGESALQFTIDVQNEKPGVGRVTTWNNKAYTFNITISSPEVP